MKIGSVFLCGALALGQGALAVEPGDSPAQVQAELGEPAGQLLSGERLLYTYPRGEVEFRSSRVVRCELVSAEEAERRRVALEVDRARQMQWAIAQREARIGSGLAALEAARADPAFDARSASEQVAFWRSFRLQYPEVPVDQEYAQSLRRLDIERLERRAAAAEEQRIAQLEERVRDAEDRLRRAESRPLHLNVGYGGYYGNYGYAFPVAYPVRVSRRSCPPPRCGPVRPVCGAPGFSLTIRGGNSTIRGQTSLVRN